MQPTLPKQEVAWGKQTKQSGSIALSLSDSVSVTLAFKPFALHVTVDGKPAIDFNGNQMFAFEHLREKKVRPVEHHTTALTASMACMASGCSLITRAAAAVTAAVAASRNAAFITMPATLAARGSSDGSSLSKKSGNLGLVGLGAEA